MCFFFHLNLTEWIVKTSKKIFRWEITVSNIFNDFIVFDIGSKKAKYGIRKKKKSEGGMKLENMLSCILYIYAYEKERCIIKKIV